MMGKATNDKDVKEDVLDSPPIFDEYVENDCQEVNSKKSDF